MRNRSPQRFVIVAVALVTVLTGCGVDSEASLRSRFAEHRTVFERLLSMFSADNHLVRIAHDFTRLTNDWSWPREDVGLSETRWDEYRELFRTAGISGGIERQGDQVFFYVSSAGLGISGRSRGIAHASEPPAGIAPDLDSRQGEGISYVSIHGPWYLFDWAH